MTTATIKGIYQSNRVGRTPYGNLTGLIGVLALASGIVTGSDATAALGIGGVVRLAVIPAGTTLLSAEAIISAALATDTTVDIGFAYVDGVDDADVPQDASYFHADLAADAAGRTLSAANAPVTLPKDAYLTVTTAAAAQTGTARLDVVLTGICNGSN